MGAKTIGTVSVGRGKRKPTTTEQILFATTSWERTQHEEGDHTTAKQLASLARVFGQLDIPRFDPLSNLQ